jgi:hypothetical protein
MLACQSSFHWISILSAYLLRFRALGLHQQQYALGGSGLIFPLFSRILIKYWWQVIVVVITGPVQPKKGTKSKLNIALHLKVHLTVIHLRLLGICACWLPSLGTATD